MKKVLLISLALLLALGLVASSCAKPAPAPGVAPTAAPEGTTYQYKWITTTGYPPDLDPGIALQRFCDKIAERTKGRVVVTPHFSAALGSWDAANESLIKGDQEMMFEALDDSWDPRLAIGYYMPYVIRSYEEAERAWSPGGVIIEVINEVTSELGYRVLGAYNLGLSGCTTNELPPSPGDPDVPKNMKIRVMALTACRLTYERLGYMAAALPWGDVYTSIQTGIVDGQMGGGAVQALMVKDVQHYYIHYCDYIECGSYSVSEAAWASLTAEDQGIILGVAQEEQKLQFENVRAMEERCMQEFRDYGNEVIILSDAEVEACATAVRQDVWPELAPIIGKALIYRVCDELGIPRPVKE